MVEVIMGIIDPRTQVLLGPLIHFIMFLLSHLSVPKFSWIRGGTLNVENVHSLHCIELSLVIDSKAYHPHFFHLKVRSSNRIVQSISFWKSRGCRLFCKDFHLLVWLLSLVTWPFRSFSFRIACTLYQSTPVVPSFLEGNGITFVVISNKFMSLGRVKIYWLTFIILSIFSIEFGNTFLAKYRWT